LLLDKLMATATTFTGISSFASSLQQVINRSVSIAALPLQQLQNQLQDLNARSSALTGLDQDFTSLQTAVQKVQTALGSGSYSGTSSNESAVGVSVTTGALEAAYDVDVNDPGSYSASVSSASLPAVADPTSSSFSTSNDFTLTIGGKPFDIKPVATSLTSLAQAINDSSAKVQASLVNTGSSAAPQYRLVLRSTDLGPVSMQLNDGTIDLLTTLNTGTPGSYTVNGLGTPIPTDSRTVTLAPGVTISLFQQTPPGQPVHIEVARNLTPVGSALSDFVNSYNTVVDDLSKQTGKDAGALSGQSIIGTLRDSLRQITQYSTGLGSVSSMSDMGVVLDRTGHLSFDASRFNTQSVNALQTFLGDSTSGFLKTVNDRLNSVEDPVKGSLKSEESLTTAQISRQNDEITTAGNKLTDLQNTLTQQMAAADSLIASLESQKNYMTNLFTAMINAGTNGSGVKSY